MKKKMSPLARLFAESRAYWPGLVATLIVTLFAGVFKVAADSLFGLLLDMGLARHWDRVLQIVIILLVLSVVEVGRAVLQNQLAYTTFDSIMAAFSLRIFSVLCKGDLETLERDLRTGDVAARVVNDSGDLYTLLAGRYMWLVRMILEALVAIVVSLFISWQLSVVYFVVMPLSLFLFGRISAPIEKQQKQASSSTGDAMNIATDSLQNMEAVKVFQLEDTLQEQFDQAIDVTEQESIKSGYLSQKIAGWSYFFDIIQLMILFIAAILLASRGLVTVGAIVTFFALSTKIRDAFTLSNYYVSTYRSSQAYADRLYEVLDFPVEQGGEVLTPDFSGHPIACENLAFSYANGVSIFQQLNLAVENQQVVGLVGPSGAGKSTVAHLICKFYQATEGRLQLFGHESHAWSHDGLRQHIALVSQNPSLFDASIYENVAHGKVGASREEVRAALQQAQLWEYVESLPGGMDFVIGERGSKLSGGQQQRLAIARAFLKDAPLIILDEPTSALDTHTEAELLDTLDYLLEGKTAIIVAHRLSTLRKADYIFCLDEAGNIAEQGTEQELMEQRGYFYKTKQLQQIKEGEAAHENG